MKDLLKKVPRYGDKMSNFVNKVQTKLQAIKSPKTNNVNSRDAELNYLYNRVMKFGGEQAHLELRDEINHRLFVDKLFKDAFPTHFGPDADLAELTVQPRNFNCLRYLMDSTENNCGKFSDYSLKYVRHLVHVCENEEEAGVYEVANKMADLCEINAPVFTQ